MASSTFALENAIDTARLLPLETDDEARSERRKELRGKEGDAARSERRRGWGGEEGGNESKSERRRAEGGEEAAENRAKTSICR